MSYKTWETSVANPPVKLLKSKGHGSPLGSATRSRIARRTSTNVARLTRPIYRGYLPCPTGPQAGCNTDPIEPHAHGVRAELCRAEL